MRTVILASAAALAAALFVATPAAASDKSDVMAAVNQFGAGFNKSDMAKAVAACADQASILDDFPPYVWQGATACSDWWNALDAFNKKNGMTWGIVTLGKPRHIDVTGDRAYVVVPTKYAFKQNGKRVTESGSIWTVALQKVAAGWRITAWAWAEH